MDAMTALTTRRSIRHYRPDPVSRSVLTEIINAGRLAPTARNVQPWEFVVVTDVERRRQLADLSEYGKFIAEAPACVVVLSKPTKYYLEDGCAATVNILNAAAALGLGGCWVAGDKKAYADRVVAACGAPPEMKLIALIAIGYAAAPGSPSKRALDEVLHWEQF
jgi:nitroreductase